MNNTHRETLVACYKSLKEIQEKRDIADFGEKDVETTRGQIRTVFRVGLDRGHDCLILGAWGCGAFKNPVPVIAGLFKEVSEEPEFKNRYRAILFACLEKAGKKDPAKGKFSPFYELFGTLECAFIKKGVLAANN